jgi:WD40 repeat protein
MLDDATGSEFKILLGHSGPVYACSFSPDKYYLISGSEDGTGILYLKNRSLYNCGISNFFWVLQKQKCQLCSAEKRKFVHYPNFLIDSI